MSTAIEKYFFTPLYYPRSNWSVIGWWESRRPLYNVLVGSVGLVSLGVNALLFPGPPLMFAGFALAYGLAANVCYTLGPLADILLRKILGDRAPAVGPAMFRYGLVFSLGLSALPVPIAIAGKIMQILL